MAESCEVQHENPWRKPCVQPAGQSQHNARQLDAGEEGGSSHAAGSIPEMDEDDPELADTLKRSLEEH